MCGITGFWCASPTTEASLTYSGQRMIQAIMHRGPDDGGLFMDADNGLVLGSRRLKILDLSSAGHQPMVSKCGRYVIVFNGEIYNFFSLRKELENASRSLVSQTDTEVILEGCAYWGVRSTVERLNGMFAFAVWDRKKGQLTLVRDRLGIKPLYYGWCANTFFFASELKALCAHPNFTAEVDRDSLALFFRYSYIPTPYSIYKKVRKLPPGCFLIVGVPPAHAVPESYWSAQDVVQRREVFKGSQSEAVDQLDFLLRDAIRLQMISDVPLGAFLSGGVDSSTVVALMEAQSSRPVRTFTIGFQEKGYNEAVHAKEVAQHLGTEHTELYLSPDEARSIIPRLASIFDEPFADSSQIPTFLVSQLTRQHVTVALSGDGGDELFAGYSHYPHVQRRQKAILFMPKILRWLTSSAIQAATEAQWDTILHRRLTFLPSARANGKLLGYRLYKFSQMLTASKPELIYELAVSHWEPASLVKRAQEPQTTFTDHSRWVHVDDFFERMMYLDLVTYLPDDILTKVDRASMAVSLEARVPLLDHRVVEYAWQLPLSFKIQHGQTKWLLRKVLYRYVPPALIERPKNGFIVPIGAWLRGPLRPWAEELLNETRLKREDFFHPEPIRRKWMDHVTGEGDWGSLLWDVLMFQAWQEKWL